MEIKVISRSKNTKVIIESVANFFAKELKLQKSNYRLVISTVPNLVKNDSMRGMVFPGEDKQLFMGLDSRLSMTDLFNTIAHEMVHVKQHAKGQIKAYTKRNGQVGYKWMGKACKTDPFNSPWELEAYSKEVILANKVTVFLMKKLGA